MKKLYLNEDRIIKIYKKGQFSMREIANKFNCSEFPIHKILKKNNIKTFPLGFFLKGKSNKKKLVLDEKKVIKLYKKFRSAVKTAKYFKCSSSKIYCILKENDILPQPKG